MASEKPPRIDVPTEAISSAVVGVYATNPIGYSFHIGWLIATGIILFLFGIYLILTSNSSYSGYSSGGSSTSSSSWFGDFGGFGDWGGGCDSSGGGCD